MVGETKFTIYKVRYLDHTVSLVISGIDKEQLDKLDNPIDSYTVIRSSDVISDKEIRKMFYNIIERKKLNGVDVFRPSGSFPWLMIEE